MELKFPVNLAGAHFHQHKFDYYRWLREESPVCAAKISLLKVFLVSRYDDCVNLLKDPRVVRNRTTATGGGRFPFPLPRGVALLAASMIVDDEPNHRRLRRLVQQAFTTSALARLEERIDRLTDELLDRASTDGEVDLMAAYALPIPVTVIAEMVGVKQEDMSRFQGTLRTLSQGLSGWRVFRTMAFELPQTVRFVRELVSRKRAEPADDILSALIAAEADGEKLSEDELVSMVFLLIVAGYETTVHLITNAVLTLLQHPDELDRLRADPGLMESTVEEVLRYRGPVHGTKLGYAVEDLSLHGVTISKGSAVMPMLGAANLDKRAFDEPEVFRIDRSPNKHLGFGHGIHFCLGAPLARMETRIALAKLLERSPDLKLAVPETQLKLQRMVGWHRYESLPVALR